MSTPRDNTPSPGALRTHLWAAFLVVGAALCLLYVAVPPLKGAGPLNNGIALYAVIAILVGIRVHRPRVSAAWYCFAGGLGLFWAGDLYTYSYPELLHADVPFPSPGDAMYIGVYPVLMAGLVILVRSRNKRADGPGVIDATIMSLGLALVSITVLIEPFIHNHALHLLPKLVSIGYPAGDIVLLAAGVRLAVDTGKRRPAFYLMIASIVTLLVTDFVYGILTQRGIYHHQLWLDVGWISFYLLWGAAALHPTMRSLSDAGVERAPRLTWPRLALLAGATLIAPVLELINVAPHHDPDLLFLIAASIVLFGLVVGRMAGLVRQRERSVSRERALAGAGGRLVAGTSIEEITRAGLQAAVELAGESAHALVCRPESDRLRVQSAGQNGALWKFSAPSGVARMLAMHRDQAPITLSALMAGQLKLPAGHRTLSVFTLSSAEQGGVWLVVSGPVAADLETRQSLSLLASQFSLALESAELAERMHRRASEERMSSLVQNSSDLITVLDGSCTITYQSPSIEGVLGYTPEEVTGRPFAELLHGDENERVLLRLADRSAQRSGSEPIECMLAGKDGSLHHFEVLCTDLLEDQRVAGLVLNGRDVSERKAFEEQLAHQAFHDPVTHLANRALFSERVRHAVARSRREPTGLAAIFVDLDDFKTINDSLGHAAGDRVLLEVAQRLSANVRAADTAARFGGDEFAILLEDVADVQQAAETAERILDALAAPLELEHKTLTVRASLGISIAEPGAWTSADELIRNADAAMYIAKGEGKGGYRVFEPAMHEQVLSRLELRADLQRALQDDEFELHYQPLVRLSDGAVTGVEALLRWNHPVRGMIPPLDFIPFAEETGMIVAIGRWVLREGCREARRLRDGATGDVLPTIGINLSVRQLFHDEIVSDVVQALTDANLEPGALTLEITESVMMTDADVASRRLAELHELGVRLAMDDFGTGYSSLSYLTRFPLDILKMDRSLLGAGGSPVTSGLASAVLGLGETFQLEVVAEGIEYPEQSATLRELGCETGQGFYFARPMPSGKLVEFLADHARRHAGEGRGTAAAATAAG